MTTRVRRPAAALAALTLVLIAGPARAGATTPTAQSATTSTSGQASAVSVDGVFPDIPLLPGDRLQASVTVPAANVPISPFMRLDAVSTRCLACTPPPAALDAVLTLTVSTKAGGTWSGTLRQLEQGITLPGGTQAAGQDRDYALTLSLPVWVGNAYEDLTLQGVLTWGGVDASGVTVAVAGKQLTGTQPPVVTHFGNSLSFTGTDVLGFIVLAGLLAATGLALVKVGRRRTKHS